MNDVTMLGPEPIGIGELTALIAEQAQGHQRYLFGLAGPPGSGKSTVAATLAESLAAVVVPMDGFHLDNDELRALGLSKVKGAPETFDASGVVRIVADLKAAADRVVAPAFDRHADRTIDGAITVTTDDRIVIVEGNYLLLEHPSWAALRQLFDQVGYLDVDHATRVERLVARHVRHGRSVDEARDFVRTSDEPNAAIVAASRHRADVMIDPTRA